MKRFHHGGRDTGILPDCHAHYKLWTKAKEAPGACSVKLPPRLSTGSTRMLLDLFAAAELEFSARVSQLPLTARREGLV